MLWWWAGRVVLIELDGDQVNGEIVKLQVCGHSGAGCASTSINGLDNTAPLPSARANAFISVVCELNKDAFARFFGLVRKDWLPYHIQKNENKFKID